MIDPHQRPRHPLRLSRRGRRGGECRAARHDPDPQDRQCRRTSTPSTCWSRRSSNTRSARSGSASSCSSRPRSAWPMSTRSRKASKRVEAMSFGVADYAASTRARTMGIGAPHPDYGMLTDKDRGRHRALLLERHLALRAVAHDGRLPRLRASPDRRAVRRFLRSRRLSRRGEARRGARLRGQMGDPSLARSSSPTRCSRPSEAEVDQGQAHRRGHEAGRRRRARAPCRLDGRLIDIASIRQAEALLNKADRITAAGG